MRKNGQSKHQNGVLDAFELHRVIKECLLRNLLILPALPGQPDNIAAYRQTV